MDKLRQNIINLIAVCALLCSTVPAALADDADDQRTAAEIHMQSQDDAVNTDTEQIPDEERQERFNAQVAEQNKGIEHFNLARYYSSKWDFRMAELEYECAIMYYPAMKIAHRDFCLVSILRGHPLRALAEVFMVIGLGEPIPLNDQERAELKARAAKTHYREGIAAARKYKWDAAISEFQYALDYAPDNGNIERSLAFSFASKGEFDKAEKAYTKSFGESPEDGYSHADFAFLLADSGKKDRAIAQLSEAVKLEPKDPALHVDMGWMAESKGDFSEAAGEFKQAVKLSPNHAGLWAHLGRVLERLGKNDEAKDAYEKALVIDPKLDETRQMLDDLKNKPQAKADKSSADQDENSDSDKQEASPTPARGQS